jgi:hypothetical protein
MTRPLADTLLALVGSVADAPAYGLTVTELSLEVPLELTAAWHRGQATILASAPHSRWQAGFLPPVHPVRLCLTLIDEDGSGQ